MKIFNDGLRFMLECFTIILLMMNGYHASTIGGRLILTLLVPLIVIIFWTIYMAPKSKRRFSETGRIVSELVIFGFTTAENFLLGNATIAFIYLIIFVGSEFFEHIVSDFFIGQGHHLA